jgi:predicted HAD superfamily hydrolase
MAKFESYDIFDTLVTRKFFKPKDLFYILEILAKENKLVNKTFDLYTIRIIAEEWARKESNKEEITINDIYNQIYKMTGISKTNLNKIKKLELYLENKSIVPIDYTLQKIKKKKNKIILISDTYLPESFIKRVLKRNKIPYKYLFISSKLNKTKGSGSLYKHVMEELAIEPTDLSHTGDNYFSDIIVPKKLGIKKLNFLDTPKPSKYEILVYKEFEKQRDIGLLLMAGIMKSTRLQNYFKNIKLQEIYEVSVDVAGPVLFLYTYWVLNKATQLNIDTLYFLSRDGQILFKLAKIIRRYFKMNVKLKYLFVSRQCLYFPSISKLDEKEIDFLLRITPNINSLLKNINLKPLKLKEVKIKLHKYGLSNFNRKLLPIEKRKLKEIILNDKEIKNLILQSALRKRKLVAAYLRQEGILKNKKIGLVDVGWTGKQQYALSKILDLENNYPHHGLVDFYLKLTNDKISPYKNDKVMEFFMKQRVKLNAALIEKFASADHGRCIGYQTNGGKIVPILEKDKFENYKIVNIHHLGILKFTENFLNTLSLFRVRFNYQKLNIAASLLNKFIVNPSKLECLVYGEMWHASDPEGRNWHRLVGIKSSISRKIIFLISTGLYEKLFNETVEWPEGYISCYYGRPFVNFLIKLYNLKAYILNFLSHSHKRFLKLFSSFTRKIQNK